MAALQGAVRRGQDAVWVIRGTPLMLQIIVILPGPGLLGMAPLALRFGGRMVAAVVAFAINYACYFRDLPRRHRRQCLGGPGGPQVLACDQAQIFFKVTLLQVIKPSCPWANEIITPGQGHLAGQPSPTRGDHHDGSEYSAKGLIWPNFHGDLLFLVFVGLLTLLFWLA